MTWCALLWRPSLTCTGHPCQGITMAMNVCLYITWFSVSGVCCGIPFCKTPTLSCPLGIFSAAGVRQSSVRICRSRVDFGIHWIYLSPLSCISWEADSGWSLLQLSKSSLLFSTWSPRIHPDDIQLARACSFPFSYIPATALEPGSGTAFAPMLLDFLFHFLPLQSFQCFPVSSGQDHLSFHTVGAKYHPSFLFSITSIEDEQSPQTNGNVQNCYTTELIYCTENLAWNVVTVFNI